MNSTTQTAGTLLEAPTSQPAPWPQAGDEPSPPRPHRRRARLVWPRLAWWLEAATIGAGYLIYEASRALTAPQRTVALAHGTAIIRAERWAHLDPEVALNHLLNLWDPLSDVAGYYYSTLHFVITPIVLATLWWRHPQIYPRLRSALVLTTASALLVFIAWPAAPPRLTNLGITDTLVQHRIMGMSDPHGVTGLINQYAAMPSLHVGWAVWCAVAVVAAGRSPWRHLAWLYPITTTTVVLATGNHYLFDAVGGALLVLAVVALTAARETAPILLGAVSGRPMFDLLPGDLVAVGGRGRRRERNSAWTPRSTQGNREVAHRRCRASSRDH